MKNFEWQVIGEKEAGLQYCTIPPGWLVIYRQIFQIEMKPKELLGRSQIMPMNGGVTMVFVSDPDHKIDWTEKEGE